MTVINKDSGIKTTAKTQVLTGSWTAPVSSSFIGDAERRYKLGVSIPGFHRLQKSGALLPHTPFTQVEWVGEHVDGSYFADDTNNWSEFSNYQGPTFSGVAYRIGDFADNDCDHTSSPDQTIPDYFVQQAAARIYASGFDALTASAEAKKTVSGFRGVARRMTDLATKFSSKRMYQLWLEGRYAWRTLAYDVRDFHEAVTEFEKTREIWTERAGLSTTHSSTTDIATTSNNDFSFTLTKSVENNFSLRGSVAGLIKPAQFRANPLETGWELVPYSFVVDWVFDVGTALQALAFQSVASSWTASKGFQCDSKVTYEVGAIPKPNRTGNCSVTWEYSGTRQSRSPVTEITTLPQLTNRALSWDLSLDLQALSQVRSKLR